MARKSPIDYTEELGERICTLIAEGNSLVKICSQDDMPHRSAVFRWLLRDKQGNPEYAGFSDKYARAMELRTEFHAEEILEICDDDSLDIGFTEEGKAFVKGENIQRSRLRVDTRKWLMAKLQPKKYGDAQTLKHADPEGNALPAPVVQVYLPDNGRDKA